MLKSNFIVYLIISSAVLLLAAMYNHFPVLNYDSGAYINNGYMHNIPNDRPITYSWFIRFFSFYHSLWSIIILQSILVSYLLLHFLSHFIELQSKNLYFIAILLLAILSQVCWYTAYLTPDIFTPIIFLSSVLVLMTKARIQVIVFGFIFYVSILMHNANFLLSILFLLVLLMASLCISRFKNLRKKILTLLGICACSWITMSSINYHYKKEFTISSTSHVFVIGKLMEAGILKQYLDTHCENNNYKLCRYKDSLPNTMVSFLFDNNYVLMQTGGWDSSKKEYTALIKDITTITPYSISTLKMIIQSFIQQVKLTAVCEDVASYLDGTNPYWKVDERFHNELPQYMQSKQSLSKLKFEGINNFYKFIFICLSILGIIAFYFHQNKRNLYLLSATVLFILLNALISSTFVSVLSRLNSRVIWLLMLWNIIVIVNFIINRYTKQKRKIVS